MFDQELTRKLKVSFYKGNKDIEARIRESLAENDFKTAHRLVHTLKGNAALINKPKLRDAAQELEVLYAVDGADDRALLNLAAQLNLVLSELEPLYDLAMEDENKRQVSTDKGKESAVLHDISGRLLPLLEKRSVESLDFLDNIRAAGAYDLAYLVESYDFKKAAAMLSELTEIK